MARFHLAVRTSNVTNANGALEILAGIKPCRVKCIDFSLVTGVVGVFGIGRPAAAGITPTTPVTFLPTDGIGDRSLASVALAWGTSPTAPTAYFKRVAVPAVIGTVWPNFEPFALSPQGSVGWVIPASTTLVLFNILGGPTLDCNIEIDE